MGCPPGKGAGAGAAVGVAGVVAVVDCANEMDAPSARITVANNDRKDTTNLSIYAENRAVPIISRHSGSTLQPGRSMATSRVEAARPAAPSSSTPTGSLPDPTSQT